MNKPECLNEKSRHKYHGILLTLFLVILPLIVYWQVRTFDFINYDDPDYIYENLKIQQGLTIDNLKWVFTAIVLSNWHPVTLLSHMADYQLFGLNAGYHHMTNVFFHLANTLLLFFILRKITGTQFRSAFVAALFALHPLHVESVAWISERKDVLSTLFMLLTLWSYVRYVGKKTFFRYLTICLFFATGLMAKPMLVTLPFLLLLMDLWPLNRIQYQDRGLPILLSRVTWRLIYEKIPLFILTVLSSVITYFAQQNSGAVQSLSYIPFQTRLFNALVTYTEYIKKMIWPDNLAIYYQHVGMPSAWNIMLSLFLLFSISFAAFRLAKKYPYFIIGWLWYLGTLIPVIGLVQVGNQSMADRYTYIPFIGLFIIFSWGGCELFTKWRLKKIGMSLSAIIIAIFSLITWNQLQYWNNSITVFRHALDAAVENTLVHNNLGCALVEVGKLEEAIYHFSAALRIKPDFADAHNNIADALSKTGRTDEALNHYLEGIKTNPDQKEIQYNLGVLLSKQGKLNDSIKHFREALRLDPNFFEAHMHFANAMEKSGNMEDAIFHYSEALRLNPGYTELHYHLGTIVEKHGRLDNAIYHYSEAVRQKPDFMEARNKLHMLTQYRLKIENIVDDIKKRINLSPSNPVLYYQLGSLYEKINEIEKAVAQYEKALSVQQEYIPALKRLAAFYMNQKKYEKSISFFKEILRHQPEQNHNYYNIACVFAKQNNVKQSLNWLKKAIEKGYNNWNLIKTDKDLENIRTSSGYLRLIEGK